MCEKQTEGQHGWSTVRKVYKTVTERQARDQLIWGVVMVRILCFILSAVEKL